MKNPIKYVLALLLSIAPATSVNLAYATHNQLTRPASTLNFSQLDMINIHDGWAIANYSLWITHNGGRSWRNVSPVTFPREGYTLTQYLNAQTAWVIIEPPFRYPKNPLPAMLYITNDGGLKWSKHELVAEQPIYYPSNFEVLSQTSVWLTAYTQFPDTMQAPPMQILKWEHDKFNKITSLSPNSHMKWIRFINEQVGFMAGNSLYQTRNSGKNWSIVKLPILNQSQGDISFPFPPFFFHSQYGILPAIIGQVNRGVKCILYITNNGGLTWKKASYLPVQALGFGLNFLNERDGWMWSPKSSYLYHTVNGGQTWTKEVTSHSFENITILQFVTNRVGYAINIDKSGTSGQIIKTSDGGTHWEQIL